MKRNSPCWSDLLTIPLGKLDQCWVPRELDILQETGSPTGWTLTTCRWIFHEDGTTGFSWLTYLNGKKLLLTPVRWKKRKAQKKTIRKIAYPSFYNQGTRTVFCLYWFRSRLCWNCFMWLVLIIYSVQEDEITLLFPGLKF